MMDQYFYLADDGTAMIREQETWTRHYTDDWGRDKITTEYGSSRTYRASRSRIKLELDRSHERSATIESENESRRIELEHNIGLKFEERQSMMQTIEFYETNAAKLKETIAKLETAWTTALRQ